MYHFLRTRELGEISSSLEYELSERWTCLQPNIERSFNLSCLRKTSFIDISSPSGLLMLCGGTDDRSEGEDGSIGIYKYPMESRKNEKLEQSLLEQKVFRSEVINMRGTWFPNDPAVFLTTGYEDGDILLWDTERFSIAVGFHSIRRRINNMRMSKAAGARTELVAISHNESRDVTLLDLNSGSLTHRLEGNITEVYDLCWSPTHPHLLATIDIRGVVYLFDVRRSGKVACLLEMDENREMPEFQSIRYSNQRYKNEMDRINENRLGLGCGWRQHGLRYRLKRPRIENVIDSRIISPTVRFTPNGMNIVSSRRDDGYQVWDVHTGRLMNWSNIPRRRNDNNDQCTRFELCRDNMHMIFASNNNICVVDIENGNRIYEEIGENIGREWNDIIIHPLEEEVCTYDHSSNRLVIWNPKKKS